MKIALAATIVLLILGCVGEADYIDAQKEADHYTDMVCMNYWPDYQQLNPDCSSYRKERDQ